ncbi:type VI secretion system protein ImpL [Stigmatella aurantiaca]|uniref:Type VI secretion system protein ImpL n=1 Tax=Stigmatella aurantiaca TaxID=41 RepID=A0A1H7NX96_STIAU|nr:type VI secretion system membrane subunit TssM [Stigmatella aurantiaca]SEL28173.1 type VI secretion system protein ImpL [Stigmatella aurantiaca]
MMFWAIAVTSLVGLAWGAIAMLGMPPVLTGLVALGVLLLLASVRWIVRKVRARKAAKKLEGALEAQAEEQRKTVRPDLQPELKAMQAEFTKAVEALKTSKLSRGRKDALAVLPWYLIVGPPGAGKSTALRNSGLKFPYLSAKGGGVRGVGGTRNCDWWLTNEAVLLDTAGRYLSSEEDRPEWFAFLDTLSKHRPKRPINGLIVAVSVSELMGADPQAVGELGQNIRERLDEITSRLRTLVPVYLMLTKCDLIPGFTEMYADLTRSERGQIWGFTVPMGSQAEASTDLLLGRFDELVNVLEQRTLKRLGQERRQDTREHIYQFPQRFDSLRKNLAEFVQPLFLNNVYQDTPVMRGLYFTSGTQDHKPVERRAGTSAELFGEARPPEPSAEGRSYFLWDIFTKVMFQDQEMAVRSSMEEQRYMRRQRLVAATYFTAAALLLILPFISFFQNRSIARDVRDAITLVQLDDRDDLARIKDLSPLQQQLQTLTRHKTEGTPFWLRFGLYQGDKLFPMAQSFYNSALRRVLLGKQYERIEQNLDLFSRNQDLPTWKPGSEDYAHHFDALKMYLLITWPRAPREPMLDDVHQDWLVSQMVRHWTHLKGAGGEANLQQAITRHARTYIQMLAAEPEQLAFARSTNLVRVTRRALNRIPITTLEMERIVAEVGREYPDQTLDDIAGNVPAMRASKRVRGAFTKVAWDQVVLARLENAFKDKEAWVLDKDALENEAESRRELRTRYYQQYIQEWRDFLNSISVRPPDDVDQMQALLESLTRGKPPAFGRLFRALTYNVQLERPKDENKSTARKVIEKVFPPEPSKKEDRKLIDENSAKGEYELGPRDVEREFATLIRFNLDKIPTPDEEEFQTALEYYQEQLAVVQAALVSVKEKPSESGALLEKIKSSRVSVALHVKKYENGGTLLERLLLPPFQDMGTTVFAGVAQAKSNDWCEAITTPLSQIMADRYPFVRSSMRDASLAEVSEFLRPSGGTLRKFIQQKLADEVIGSGRKWTFSNLNTRDMYREDLITFLEKTNALATTLFPGDTMDPLVRFQVRIRAGTSPDTAPSEIASITLTIDGTDEVYRNGPDNVWKPMLWPGQAGKLGAHIHVENASGATADIDEPGEWGLFRLLERVKRIEPSGDGRFFTAFWEIEDMNGAIIAIDFRPERTANPFFGVSGNNTSRLLQVFRDPGLLPPRGIARRGKACLEEAPKAIEAVSANGTP